ncbi:MAG TPA: hypothetical protein PK465_03455 [Saccharofermentans sp.]|nr:hypothetical protein [Saccharofermentans sp.]HPQ32070.1 hypothetical protein [Saccharofermentans sp.]
MDDAKDLVKVYGEKNALQFFNIDSCHDDIFMTLTSKGCRKHLSSG